MSRRNDVSLTRTLLSAALTVILVGLLALVFRVVSAQDQVAPAQTRNDGEQPLAFSHRVHASDHAIPCQLCHTYARRGPVAGIPSVRRCVQCHLTIKPNGPEIVKLMASWEAKEPIAWVRVHNLPDYVQFTHKRHVLAGVTCQTCHGDVAQMNAAVKTAPLTMGWCLGCHKERHAPTDCLACHH